LELVNNDGVVSKKKVIDGAKTVAFRALPIIRAANSAKEDRASAPDSSTIAFRGKANYRSNQPLK
jgi:hypothetical protein